MPYKDIKGDNTMTKMTREEVERAVSRSQSLIDEDLSGIDLSRADLSDTDLRGADLRYANLEEADLGLARLSRADLREADLGLAYLSGANLREADLRSADLSGADLRGVNLSGANLRHTKLTNANLSRVKGIISAELGQYTIIANKSVSYGRKSGINISIGCVSYYLEGWLTKARARDILITDFEYTEKEFERYYEFILSVERMLND